MVCVCQGVLHKIESGREGGWVGPRSPIYSGGCCVHARARTRTHTDRIYRNESRPSRSIFPCITSQVNVSPVDCLLQPAAARCCQVCAPIDARPFPRSTFHAKRP